MRRLIIFLLFVSTGCSINPYSSKFRCPETYKGRCTALERAYTDSLSNQDTRRAEDYRKKKACKDGDCSDRDLKSDKDPKSVLFPDQNNTYQLYRQTVYRELTEELKKPKRAVIAPPKTIRVLIFPYHDKDVLFLQRYVYILVDQPKWVVGDYLMEE
ncbi:MAG: hypothetical protein D6710_10985 [Nitrospirae bacterium]|nr:MAG: hypothetical protein D6710_10985 [Nitrospirota bacterium]